MTPDAETGAVTALTEQQLADRQRASLAEEVRSAFDYLPASLAGNVAGMGVMAFLFWESTPRHIMVWWLLAFGLMLAARIFFGQRFKRAQASEAVSATLVTADWKAWRLTWNLGTLSSAAMWGATAWLFYPGGQSIEQIGLIITIYTLSVAVVPVLATQPKVFLAFAALCFLPMAARVASEGTAYGYELAGILVLVFALTTVLARSYRQALRRAIDLKLRADDLSAQLQVEKRAADDARAEAEVANRAKTQFFTAASHDLRQPLHAMGLFAEALRQKNNDVGVAHLVNSINESVDALEGLFSELLDISRIDSGGVEVQPEHFVVGDILRKLRLHFEPVAFEKGLALRLRGGQHTAHADPLLVERILRNLVSNAIRYTVDGTVLVSCRRKGDALLLQVWDSGVGISQEQQARVFEEFYQVPGAKLAATHEPAHRAGTQQELAHRQLAHQTLPHERKGLGLGLAIVKRLAGLLHAPLTMQSQLGRGTVFSLVLPAGKPARQAPASPAATTTRNLTLKNRLIVVVEDEPAVLAGLEAVLTSWGASLATFQSVAACKDWLRSAQSEQVQPDLLIVDLRLEEGRTGVEVITALRTHFNRKIPAIVVTGSTMTGHEQEAQDLDFHVLIKPVLPNKLRAMIAFKLDVKSLG